MREKRSCGVALFALLGFAGVAQAYVGGPELLDAIKAGNLDQIASICARVEDDAASAHVPIELWRVWLPALMNTGHYKEASEVALAAVNGRAGPDAIGPILEFRARALLASGDTAGALGAAKSYYNACALKDTGNAVTLLCDCLAAASPGDKGVAGRFRAEQAAASSAAANVLLSPQGSAATQPSPGMLDSISINARDFDSGLQRLAGRPDFASKVAYANLLLAAGRASEAEKIMRDEYLIAEAARDLPVATEAIAKALRAEDGNVFRADVWLWRLQHATAPPGG